MGDDVDEIPNSTGPSDEIRSGFVAIVGRPNVGKSTLLNTIVDSKVTIVSNKAQTTRNQIRGVLNRERAQVVFVDTPGISKARTPLGTRLNSTAADAQSDVDVVCLVIDARSGFGKGDRFLIERLKPAETVLVANKIDGMDHAKVMAQLALTSEFDFAAYFPISAWTGKGVKPLVDYLVEQMPVGPLWYPSDVVSDAPEAFVVAELVREQLFHITRDELPHSIATRVVEWEWPRIRVEILVERESQKGIVIGKGGTILKEVGTRVRKQLPEGAFLELVVNVEKNWQQDPHLIERLGY